MTWTCGVCGREHPELPLVYGAEAPWRAMGVAPEELAGRVQMNADLCVVDGEHFFIRGHIELPIVGHPQPFAWSVWCSLSRESYDAITAAWDRPDRAELPPRFGWLCTALPTYPSTMHLKTMVHQRAPGLVPLVDVEPTDHPLAVEQRTGITMQRVEQIAHAVLP